HLKSLNERLDLCSIRASGNDDIYTLSLHDALPISWSVRLELPEMLMRMPCAPWMELSSRSGLAMARLAASMARFEPVPTAVPITDRKSTRLNSSHVAISYAVFCLKKKMQENRESTE